MNIFITISIYHFPWRIIYVNPRYNKCVWQFWNEEAPLADRRKKKVNSVRKRKGQAKQWSLWSTIHELWNIIFIGQMFDKITHSGKHFFWKWETINFLLDFRCAEEFEFFVFIYRDVKTDFLNCIFAIEEIKIG